MNAGRGKKGIASRARGRRIAPLVVLLGLVSPLLAGCLQLETVVRVNKDGSGTIAHRFLMSHEMIGMLAQMASDGQPSEILDEAKLRQDAEKYGETVRLLSAEPLETEFGKGYEARFAFEDVNRLQIDQDPSSKLPNEGPPTTEAEDSEPTFVTFAFDAGDPAVLLVRLPIERDQSAVQPSTGDGTAEQDPAALEMLKAFFTDMRIAMRVEIAGEIVETNATYRDGARVTLLDIAFEELLSHEGAVQAMMVQGQQSLADMKEELKNVPGLKMEFEPEVRISFR